MTTAVVVTDHALVRPLLTWAARVARALDTDITVVHPIERPGDRERVSHAFEEGNAPDEIDSPMVKAIEDSSDLLIRPDGDKTAKIPVRYERIGDPDIVPTLLDVLRSASTRIVIIGRGKGSPAWLAPLFERAESDTLLLRPASEGSDECRRILVPTAGGLHTRPALRLACEIAASCDAEVEALYIEPPIGTDAERVGRRILDDAIRRAAPEHIERVRPRVKVSADVREGIVSTLESGDYDLVILGDSSQGRFRRRFFGSVPTSVLEGTDGLAAAVFRRGLPLTTRLEAWVARRFRQAVPQLDRESRLALVEKIQANSLFNFDFVALVCLSTLIAALGLMQDSAAVVIGAMLVAPLMTPLIGCGMALVHGNLVLIRNATRSVLLGFLLAFVLGVAMGLVHDDDPTPQMLARGTPSWLDIGVALASGIAAAYATARPRLAGALAGVAIAAALVPPIATAGIATALMEWPLAAGALTLFAVNIVNIVLGAAFSLYAVGLRGDTPPGRRQVWIQHAIATLIVLAALLATALTVRFGPTVKLPAPTVAELEEILDRRGARLSTPPIRDAKGVRLTLEAPALPDRELLRSLERVVHAEIPGAGVRIESSVVAEFPPVPAAPQK